jgi:hypothetical protein
MNSETPKTTVKKEEKYCVYMPSLDFIFRRLFFSTQRVRLIGAIVALYFLLSSLSTGNYFSPPVIVSGIALFFIITLRG